MESIFCPCDSVWLLSAGPCIYPSAPSVIAQAACGVQRSVSAGNRAVRGCQRAAKRTRQRPRTSSVKRWRRCCRTGALSTEYRAMRTQYNASVKAPKSRGAMGQLNGPWSVIMASLSAPVDPATATSTPLRKSQASRTQPAYSRSAWRERLDCGDRRFQKTVMRNVDSRCLGRCGCPLHRAVPGTCPDRDWAWRDPCERIPAGRYGDRPGGGWAAGSH